MIHVISGFDTITGIAKTTAAETPAKGKAAISGVLYDHTSDRVIPGNLLYLIPALMDGDKAVPPAIFMGARAEHGDVSGKSNEKGQVFLKDIPPGKYYLAVWEPLDWYLSFDSEKAPMPLLITLQADQKLDLGLLYVRGE